MESLQAAVKARDTARKGECHGLMVANRGAQRSGNGFVLADRVEGAPQAGLVDRPDNVQRARQRNQKRPGRHHFGDAVHPHRSAGEALRVDIE